MVGNGIRDVLALISLLVFVAISFSEQNPVFVIFGIVVAVIFLRLGKGRSRGRRGGDGEGDYGSDNNGGWFGGDGGNGGGNGGGGD
ncbi:MAG: hypothetical protein H0X71_02820 [Rubrobacter sp.]|nr:hypothetical protein [Rubrobacter sp.]